MGSVGVCRRTAARAPAPCDMASAVHAVPRPARTLMLSSHRCRCFLLQNELVLVHLLSGQGRGKGQGQGQGQDQGQGDDGGEGQGSG